MTELVERLRRTSKGYYPRLINPDGSEAADQIEGHEAAIREARAAAFDDAAAIIRMQYLHGGLSLMTEGECLQASYIFSNQAVLLRRNFQ
jgi:hypothetical protein